MNRKTKRERLRRVRFASIGVAKAIRNERKYVTALWIGKRMRAQNRLRNAWRYGGAIVPWGFWRNPKTGKTGCK